MKQTILILIFVFSLPVFAQGSDCESAQKEYDQFIIEVEAFQAKHNIATKQTLEQRALYEKELEKVNSQIDAESEKQDYNRSKLLDLLDRKDRIVKVMEYGRLGIKLGDKINRLNMDKLRKLDRLEKKLCK